MSYMYRMVKKYAESLRSRIVKLERAVKETPPGNLIIRKRGKKECLYSYEYRAEGIHQTRLSIEDLPLIIQYAKKKYSLFVLPTLKKNLKACDLFLKNHSQKDERDIADTLNPKLLSFIPDFVNSPKLYAEQWVQQEHPSFNTKNPEGKIYETRNGDFVRSKSEVIIADALYDAGIPYKYEYPLLLPGRKDPVYPDFTILNKRTSQEFYWEHFGRVDDKDYANTFVMKMEAYRRSGIIKENKLISTFETLAHPLSSSAVEEVISSFFG